MTRGALHLVATADDLYVTSAAQTPRAVVGDAAWRQAADVLAVVDALEVLPERGPKSGVRLRGAKIDLEGM